MGGGGDLGGPKKKKKPVEGEDFIRHQRARVAIHIDMTPMVDVAMLLLIFFMVTTVFRNPQAMELNLPPDEEVEVPESNVMTVAVREDGKMYQRVARAPWRELKLAELKTTIEELVKVRPQIIALIKVAPTAPYHHLVDVMDELQLANFSRLSVLRLEEPDLSEVLALP
jgi:biopolymer transport protein ExbD